MADRATRDAPADDTANADELSTAPADAPTPGRIDQREEAAKAIRFMAIKAGIFILIPVIASALAILFLL